MTWPAAICEQNQLPEESEASRILPKLRAKGYKYTPEPMLDNLFSEGKRGYRTVCQGRPPDLKPYPVLAFEDQFDELSIADSHLDPSPGIKWFAPARSSFGWAEFQKLSASPSTFAVSDGVLRIRAQESQGRWQSGCIGTVNDRHQGFAVKGNFYVEARMLAAQKIGGWSAVWMTSLSSPTTGMHAEVDLVESYGSATYGFNHAVHVWPGNNAPPDAAKTHKGYGAYPKTPVASDGSWHVYAAEMTDNWIIFHFDGRETFRVPRPPEWDDAPWRI